VVTEKGIKGLYGGFTFNTINGIIGSGILVAYDMIQSLIITNYVRNRQLEEQRLQQQLQQQQDPPQPPETTD
jgi:hypothetical protein